MRFAYADPPYIGQAKIHYGDQPDYGGEVDHAALIHGLVSEFPDGWALSAHSNSLRQLLPLCPESVRVAAWTKRFAFYKKGVNPAYAWEPVIFSGGRSDAQRRKAYGVKHRPTIRDWYEGHAWGVTAKERADSTVKGRKREEFCFWIFELLGMHPSDDFVDMFPGSGAVSRAWDTWRARPTDGRIAGPLFAESNQ